jgi:CheY-like chemotaxis protein
MKRALVCDDEPHIARLVQVNLEKHGYHVELAFDGHEAKEVLAKQEFDVAVLDMIMPRADGLEVIEYLRNDLKSNIPIILLTLEAGPELERRVEPYQPVKVVMQIGKYDWVDLLDTSAAT